MQTFTKLHIVYINMASATNFGSKNEESKLGTINNLGNCKTYFCNLINAKLSSDWGFIKDYLTDITEVCGCY